MIANSYGKTACEVHICAAVSYWPLSPVPLSPITRNLTESVPTGGWTSVLADMAGALTGAGARCCAASACTTAAQISKDHTTATDRPDTVFMIGSG